MRIPKEIRDLLQRFSIFTGDSPEDVLLAAFTLYRYSLAMRICGGLTLAVADAKTDDVFIRLRHPSKLTVEELEQRIADFVQNGGKPKTLVAKPSVRRRLRPG